MYTFFTANIGANGAFAGVAMGAGIAGATSGPPIPAPRTIVPSQPDTDPPPPSYSDFLAHKTSFPPQIPDRELKKLVIRDELYVKV